jgi:hypothetical protein
VGMAEKGDDAFAYLFSGDSGCEVSYCGFRREVKIGERPKPFGEEYEKRVRQFVGDLDANLKAVDGGGQFTMPLCCLERIVDEEGVGLTPYLGESQGVALASDLLELSFWWIASMGKEGVFRGVWGDFPVSLVRQDEHGDGWRSRFSLLVGNYDQASHLSSFSLA